MRNILSFHKVDYSKVVDAAIQTCLNDSKALMSSTANKWVGGLSSIKLPSDTNYFWYIPNIKAKGYNRQTNAHNESTTGADQYWQWALYNDDWTISTTYRQNSSFPRGRSDIWYWVHQWVQSWYTPTFTFPRVDWNNSSHWLSEIGASLDYWDGMSTLWVGAKWKYIYVFANWHSRTSWWPGWNIRVFDTSTKSGTRLITWWDGAWWPWSYCFIENKTTIRVYVGISWWYIDIDKDTAAIWSWTWISDIWTFINTHPNWEYEDLEWTTPYINLWAHSQWAFFNWQKVWTGWYFQRGRDNKAMEYIFRPVNLVTSGNSWWWATSGAAIQ